MSGPLVALLRAVNVGGRRVRSVDLRAAAQQAGCTAVTTYLASGNVVALADEPPEVVAAALSARLREGHGFDVPVLARDLPQWDAIVAGLPFTDEAARAPTTVALLVLDGPAGTEVALDPARLDAERVVWAGTHAYLHYPDGQGRSRLTLDVLQRACGRTGTARSWRTVLALQSLAAQRR